MRLETCGAVPFEDMAPIEPSEFAEASVAPGPTEVQSQEASRTLCDMAQQLPRWVNPAPATDATPISATAWSREQQPASDRSLLNAREQSANPAAYTNVRTRAAESGDSWARIARQEYGDERYAQALAQANRAKSSLLLRGQQVTLPDLHGADLRAGGAFIAADAAARAAPAHSVIDAPGADLSGASFDQMSAQAPAVSEVRIGLGGRIEANPEWVGANGEAHIVPPFDPSAESNRLSSLGVAMRDIGMASTNWSEAARGAGGHAFNWLVQGGAADALTSPDSMQLDPGIRTELRNLATGDGPYVPKTDAEKGGYGALVSVPSFGLEVAGAIEGVRGLGALGSAGSAEIGTLRELGSRGIRNTEILTPAQQQQLYQHVNELGLNADDFVISSHVSAYSENYDRVLMGPNLFRATEGTGTVNSVFQSMTPRAAVAHEAGHMITTRAGLDFEDGSLFDEVNASLTGRTLPGLNDVERYQLLRDAAERARLEGQALRDVLQQMQAKRDGK